VTLKKLKALADDRDFKKLLFDEWLKILRELIGE